MNPDAAFIEAAIKLLGPIVDTLTETVEPPRRRSTGPDYTPAAHDLHRLLLPRRLRPYVESAWRCLSRVAPDLTAFPDSARNAVCFSVELAVLLSTARVGSVGARYNAQQRWQELVDTAGLLPAQSLVIDLLTETDLVHPIDLHGSLALWAAAAGPLDQDAYWPPAFGEHPTPAFRGKAPQPRRRR